MTTDTPLTDTIPAYSWPVRIPIEKAVEGYQNEACQLREHARRLERERAELIEALKMMREEYSKLPYSLGYSFTHLPKIDTLLASLRVQP